MRCPFCGEDDFDSIGLKTHLIRGDCDAFEALPITHTRVFISRDISSPDLGDDNKD